MLKAWCDAFVRTVTYEGAHESRGARLPENKIPSEEVLLRLSKDTMSEDHDPGTTFDYSILELLWPGQDTSNLDELTRLVVAFAALQSRGGRHAVPHHIDLVCRKAAGSNTDSLQLQYRDRLWAASQIADLLWENA